MAAVRSCVAAMLSSLVQAATARHDARRLLPVGSIGSLLCVMCTIVACRAVFVKSFSKNFCTELVKLMHGADS